MKANRIIPLVSLCILSGSAVFAQTTPGQASQKLQVTPEQALQMLKEGNARYLAGKSAHPRIDPARREETAAEGQKPIATVLGCSDARVPVEMAFDQGFGDLFVVRVAGNVCAVAEIASIEYGVRYLRIPLVVVLGHTKCGAVQAAVTGANVKGSLPQLMRMIQPAVEKVRKDHPGATSEALLQAAVEQNVRYSMRNLLLGSEKVRAAVLDKRIKLVGAVRDIKTGNITWLGEHPRQAMLLKGQVSPTAIPAESQKPTGPPPRNPAR